MGLYLDNPVQPPCSPKYINNDNGGEFQLNAIPLNYEDGVIQVYFPRPFLIMGLDRSPLSDIPFGVPPGDPHLSKVFSIFETPANQLTYANMTFELMVEFALATMWPAFNATTNPRPITYVSAGIQKTDYRGYFTKFLNDDITIADRRQWLNSFIQPSSKFYEFASNNSADASSVWDGKFYEFLKFIEKTSCLTLYGSPGLYQIKTGVGTFADEWLLPVIYETQPEA